MVKMPQLFHIWNNFEEGCFPKAKYDYHGGKDRKSFFYMWFWLTIRNPVNNLRTTPLYSLDMFQYHHEIYRGAHCYLTVSTLTFTNKEKYSFRYRKPNKNPEHGDFIFHLGYKAFDHIVNQYQIGMINPNDPVTRYRGFAIQLIPRRK